MESYRMHPTGLERTTWQLLICLRMPMRAVVRERAAAILIRRLARKARRSRNGIVN